MPYERDPYQNALMTNRPRNALRPVTVANGLQGMPNGLTLQNNPYIHREFDPEGDDYDYYSAYEAGLKPIDGHWPSRDPKTGLLLKGRKHSTWDLLEKGEREAGYKIYKNAGRYYSKPNDIRKYRDPDPGFARTREEMGLPPFPGDPGFARTREEMGLPPFPGDPGFARSEWYSPDRQSGSVEPGIYAEPTRKQKARELLPKWYTRERREEGIYAEPRFDLSLLVEDAGLPGIGMIKAFHGGGVFKKFSDKFMKSGTGGHVFGWGHYVSEEKGVGKHYADLYTKEHGGALSINGKKMDPSPDNSKWWNSFRDEVGEEGVSYLTYGHEEEAAADLLSNLSKTGGDTNAVRRMYSLDPDSAPTAVLKRREDIHNLLDIIDQKKVEVTGGGAQYKVKLFKGKDPSEYTFLDWDKPVTDDIASVIRSQLKKEGVSYQNSGLRLTLDKRPMTRGEYGDTYRMYQDKAKVDAMYKAYMDAFPDQLKDIDKGGSLYEDLDTILGSKEAASKFLERAGISGIRFPVGSLSGIKHVPERLLIDGKPYKPKNVQTLRYAEESGGDKNKILERLHRARAKVEDFKGSLVYQDALSKKANAALPRRYDEQIKSIDDEIQAISRGNKIELEPGKKNYVIFDPKNIQIEEGPGFRRVMEGEKPVKAKSAGTWTPPEHPKLRQPAKGAGAVRIAPQNTGEIEKKWEKGGIKLGLYEKNNEIDLLTFIIPKGQRKKGTGTKIMNEITEYADRTNNRIVLSPGLKDDYQGTTSRTRLVKFYKRFGFVENKGRNKDFTISKGMYREPQKAKQP